MTLLQLQRRIADAIMTGLNTFDRSAKKTGTGVSMAEVAAELIKPNDRLTSLERLEIYNRQYWFRLLDSMYEDFPGLRAILGQGAFDRLVRIYLTDCPSRSFTLRDLGSQLESWLLRNREYAGAKLDRALDMIRLEWAHIEAFDGASEKVLGLEDLRVADPELQLGLQPYIRLLDLRYPVDDVRVQVNAADHEHIEEHGAASNAVSAPPKSVARQFSRIQPKRIYLAVHRLDGTVYYRRLTVDEYRLLEALKKGKPLGQALASLTRSRLPSDQLGAAVETWFATWAELGWFCRPPAQSGNSSAPTP